jgi:hypothetical protein
LVHPDSPDHGNHTGAAKTYAWEWIAGAVKKARHDERGVVRPPRKKTLRADVSFDAKAGGTVDGTSLHDVIVDIGPNQEDQL